MIKGSLARVEMEGLGELLERRWLGDCWFSIMDKTINGEIEKQNAVKQSNYKSQKSRTINVTNLYAVKKGVRVIKI